MSERDSDRLERYVNRFFKRKRMIEWPTIRDASRGLGWTIARIEEAIDDCVNLDTQSYLTETPTPRSEHEIYSYSVPEST